MNSKQTIRWSVDKLLATPGDDQKIGEAAKVLRAGGTVAFPTETVYGLGANAYNEEAVRRIFKAKGRPVDNPLIVHISSEKQLYELASDLPDYAEALAEAFWPGALTLVVPHAGAVTAAVTAGLETVGIRMPEHPIALALINAAGLPLAAPSANMSGRPSPTSGAHVWEDLNGKIDGLVDGGLAGVGVESTVVDCSGDKPVILRPGGVTKEAIEALIGPIAIDPALKEATIQPKSPGVKYTHYAPKATLLLVDKQSISMEDAVKAYQAEGKKVGLLLFEENETLQAMAAYSVICGNVNEPDKVASALFASLRAFDTQPVDIILSETVSETGIGAAIMNRLTKAAGHQWYRVGE
ncbi:L-threonylcarbamoyladenylate synthase [Aureibacillus halotolerans]|uniref:Threonylcarbamoyl-AMP synthase n=1 Tax=Aureibacillus halotolerans TaxID=1508390 RepID=A0A4R6TZF5_9BACI|nr:translation factor SUA5 [Aureibacillus halotolerans]